VIMESRRDKGKVLLELTKEEAIVLFDWLSRFNQVEKSELFSDQAEKRVLWDMECSIERVISEIFVGDYTEILSKARSKVRD